VAGYAASPEPSFAGRFFTAIIVCLVVEVVRFAFDPTPYTSDIWLITSGATVINLVIHWFNPSRNNWWTILSAGYNQTTLAYTGIILWRTFIVAAPQLVPAIPRI
jgi:hypothetical protein